MLLLILTYWHLLLFPAFGLLMVGLSYLSHRLNPPPLAPEFILNMEKEALLAGREIKATENAIEKLVEAVPEVGHRASARTAIDDEVLTAYNSYKRQCIQDREVPLGLSRWVSKFDPDLYKRVFVD